MAILKERWSDVNQKFHVDEKTTGLWWDIIQTRYSEKQRHYHTLDHLDEMFRHFDEHDHKLKQPNLVILAIFFHDLIYDPTKKDNEEKSAAEFLRYTQEASVTGTCTLTESDCKTVEQWILFTKNHTATAEGCEDYHYFLDMDMAVLGRPEKEYFIYAQQIEKEYCYLSDYQTRRSKFLSHFCQRERIYSTKEFHERLHSRGIENMMKEIDYLNQ